MMPRLHIGLAAGLTAVALAGAALTGCDDSSHPAAVSPTTTASPYRVQTQTVHVVKTVSPQVVQIETDRGLGSGVIFDNQGHIVTNAHVVTGAHKFVVTLVAGDDHPATLVGSDPGQDIAVVRVSGVNPQPATFGDSSQLEVGDSVLAVGNPLGLRSSVTDGIVSSLGRTVPESRSVTLKSTIQTSAAINPGNSGGALADLEGNVVGIPTLAATDPDMGGAQAPGIGFVIPSNTVKQVAAGIIAGE